MRKFGLAISFALIASAVGQADITFSFTPTGAATSFTVMQGSTVDVPVFLIDVAPMTTLATDGLISVGNRLSFDTAVGSATVTMATINPQFGILEGLDGGTNFFRINNPGGSADIAGSVFLNPAIKAPAILVGTYKFQGNMIGNVTNVMTRIPIDPGILNFNVTDLGASLDSTILNATTTITTVPEPSSFLFIGVASLIGGLGAVFARYYPRRT